MRFALGRISVLRENYSSINDFAPRALMFAPILHHAVHRGAIVLCHKHHGDGHE